MAKFGENIVKEIADPKHFFHHTPDVQVSD